MDRSQANILVVEDDPYCADMLADLLIHEGYGVQLVPDGRAALEYLQQELPDLVITDMNMPRMDGVEFCLSLKTNIRTRMIPLIVITGSDSPDDQISSINAGADDFIQKPFRPRILWARVRSLLRLKKLYDSLEAAENVVHALVRAIEAKDKYTEGHTERVTAYALRLGQAVGCKRYELETLRQGGILHDVGKIGIPDNILRKPGPLTDAEYEIIKMHPLIGCDICASLKSLSAALPCIRFHHEKPNGRGYPDGLCGTDIPLVARIMAVADVYDALTSDRPYRAAMDEDHAHKTLEREAERGGLDETLVRTFLDQRLSDTIGEYMKSAPVLIAGIQ